MKARQRRAVIHVVAAAGCALCAGGAWALTDEAIFRGLGFDSIVTGVPGVRPPGMGGATVALDSGVTAVQANPAGLHFVRGGQVFAEYRFIEQDTRISEANMGSLSVDPVSGARDLPFLGLTSVSEPESLSGVSFIGCCGPPIRSRRRRQSLQ